jgi:hypothetical protein
MKSMEGRVYYSAAIGNRISYRVFPLTFCDNSFT